MLVKQELIARIKDYFDLNMYETKVWLALLGKGIASAGEVAGISGVPRSRTYDVLENLEKKGFAIAKLGKPAKYIGVKPMIMLEKLENNLRKDVEKKITTFSNIKETKEFKQLEDLYKQSSNPVKRENISVALEGKSNISGYLKEIIRNAKKEVIICTDAEDMNLKIRLFHKTFEILQKAGIKVKVALSGDDNLIKQLRSNLKIKIKKVNIDAKFFIIDKREILFYLSKDTSKEDVAIWLNSEFFANAFAFLFEKTLL
ncbi:TrmB family transcriptional regulator [Candidatus Pacearchaeota archaeon]|nr:TrmB family transcriptional regulator [Candidatus Pacearchaeota archaeon]